MVSKLLSLTLLLISFSTFAGPEPSWRSCEPEPSMLKDITSLGIISGINPITLALRIDRAEKDLQASCKSPNILHTKSVLVNNDGVFEMEIRSECQKCQNMSVADLIEDLEYLGYHCLPTAEKEPIGGILEEFGIE